MSTEQNKAVVRRFITDIVVGGNFSAADELVAPNYVNSMMPGLDFAGFKAAAVQMSKAIQESHADDLTLIAEGNQVVARFIYRITLANGKKLSARNLTYFRLDKGKIVEDDPIMTLDLHAELAALMPQPVAV
ncbi:MAG: nuclear transport factor 2 family protein [Candidatus Limnocylindrales bacterium]|jgi:predicted SnoaL-like aldol condensation-catalyzing enzyme